MLLVLAAGFAQPIQAMINSHVAERGATVFWAAAISAVVTAVTLAVVAGLILRIAPPSPGLLATVPFFALAGGMIGALVLSAITTVTPKLGATVTYLCFVAGITLSSLLLDQFGVLGLPQQSLTLPRAAGIALIVGGIAVIRLA